ncbi:cytochrome P450 [Streptosporangiaceae bacterium NEAU-GS5]|nr:cytochrome P450 [Streptosporangiaceae bacterium NEAU-GS5]
MAREIPTASRGENLRFLLAYTAATLLRGPYAHGPRGASLAARLDATTHALRAAQEIRRRHGGLIWMPRWTPGTTGRTLLVLAPEDVEAVLSGPAELYSPDSPDKHGMAVFQPDGLSLSRGRMRRDRRDFAEYVLDSHAPRHRLCDRITRIVRTEMTFPGQITHAEAGLAFRRIARRILFGDPARDDEMTTDILRALRSDANWDVNWRAVRRLRGRRDAKLLELFTRRVSGYVRTATAGSLMSQFADAPICADPSGQVAQWLMAFESTTTAVLQCLALLSTHPHQRAEAVRNEDYLRACFMEAVRLWDPVPSITRATTGDADLRGAHLPEDTSLLIPVGLLQRDDERLDYADRFAPEIWLNGTAERDWTISPFSRGEAGCPGRDLATLVAMTALSTLLRGHRYALAAPEISASRPLPRTIDTFAIKLVALPGPVDTRAQTDQEVSQSAAGS